MGTVEVVILVLVLVSGAILNTFSGVTENEVADTQHPWCFLCDDVIAGSQNTELQCCDGKDQDEGNDPDI